MITKSQSQENSTAGDNQQKLSLSRAIPALNGENAVDLQIPPSVSPMQGRPVVVPNLPRSQYISQTQQPRNNWPIGE